MEQGLPSSQVHDIYQDHLGMMWFATDNGLARYDGRTFKIFTIEDGLPSNFVLRFAEQNKDTIWVSAVTRELAYFNPRTLKIVPYQYNDSIIAVFNEYSSPYSFAITPSGGMMMNFFNETETLFIDSAGYRTIIKSPPDTTLLEVVNLWNGGRGVMNYTRAENLECKVHRLKFYGNDSLYILPVQIVPRKGIGRSLVMLNDGRIGVRYGNTFSLYDPSDHELCTSVFPENVISVSVTVSGKIWLGFRNSGVIEYPETDVTYLNGYTVTSVWEDMEGGSWFSTLEKGIFYTPDLKIRSFSRSNSTNYVTSLGVLKDEVLVGYYNSDVWSVDLKKMMASNFLEHENKVQMPVHIAVMGDKVRLNHSDNLDGIDFQKMKSIPFVPIVYNIIYDQGSFYVLSLGCIFKLDPDLGLERILYTKSRNFDFMTCNGDWFVATSRGVMRFDRNCEKNTPYKELVIEGICNQMIQKGDWLLVATADKGVVCYNLNSGKKQMLDKSVGLPDQLPFAGRR